MVWHAVPVAIMAGVCGYAAVLFVGLYSALRRIQDQEVRREYLSFALFCAAVASYDASAAALYDARTLAQGVIAQRFQIATAGAVAVAYIRFTWDVLKAPMPKVVRVAQAVLGALAVIGAVWSSSLTLTLAAPAIKRVQLGGMQVVYYEAEVGLIVQLLFLGFFVFYLVMVGYLYRHFRKQSREQVHGTAGLFVAMLVSCATVINDMLVTSGAYAFLYTFEYGMAAILTAMGFVLLTRFGVLHDTVESLNRDLSRANVELSIALERAQESVRLKTEFLASMSHELRTPLNAIINLPEGVFEEFQLASVASCHACHAQFELEPGETFDAMLPCAECGAAALALNQQYLFAGDGTRARSCLATVVNAGKHLLGLVNDILSASKLELGRARIEPERVEVGELVREVVASAQTVASQKQVQIVVREADAEAAGEIVCDRIKLAQVLYNLVGNAIKFSVQGGAVEVELSRTAGGLRRFCVRDHGIGIALEHHELIFEKFRQVDGGATRSHGGTGLGLAISKALVELHGGRIWVESVSGEGASFFVELPASGVAQ